MIEQPCDVYKLNVLHLPVVRVSEHAINVEILNTGIFFTHIFDIR